MRHLPSKDERRTCRRSEVARRRCALGPSGGCSTPERGASAVEDLWRGDVEQAREALIVRVRCEAATWGVDIQRGLALGPDKVLVAEDARRRRIQDSLKQGGEQRGCSSLNQRKLPTEQRVTERNAFGTNQFIDLLADKADKLSFRALSVRSCTCLDRYGLTLRWRGHIAQDQKAVTASDRLCHRLRCRCLIQVEKHLVPRCAVAGRTPRRRGAGPIELHWAQPTPLVLAALTCGEGGSEGGLGLWVGFPGWGSLWTVLLGDSYCYMLHVSSAPLSIQSSFLGRHGQNTTGRRRTNTYCEKGIVA
jgi:hypothetical protein